jgi:hypothetical protein
MAKIMIKKLCIFSLLFLFACSKSNIQDAIDVAQGVDRKPIDRSKLGINAFVNDGRFGSIAQQFTEVKNVLGIPRVRILLNWDSNVQPAPGSEQNFGFDDAVVSSIPAGMRAIAVVTGLPAWMSDSKNWTNGDPRQTFINKWLRNVVERYGKDSRIEGFELWNEPNMESNNSNQILGFAGSPETYAAFFSAAAGVARSAAPGKLVLNAATTAINQNFPDTQNYNERMRDAGVLANTDVWNIHYYGRQYENVIQKGGVADFLNGLGKPVWVTESGAQGTDKQLEYGEQTWPFLLDKSSAIQRIYIYQFTEDSPPSITYGLRNLSKDRPVSDLYVSLANKN